MVMGKLRWGDTLDDDDVLPQGVVRGPDENGIKTVIDYFRNDKGDTIKKTVKTKVISVEKKVYLLVQRTGCLKGCAFPRRLLAAQQQPARARLDGETAISEQRKKWPKFGAAQKDTPQDSVTVQAVEEIPFERVRQVKATSAEKKTTDLSSMLAHSNDKQMISGSLKDILYRKRMERELLRAKGLLKGPETAPGEEGGGGESNMGAPKPGSYVPPSRRGGGGSVMPDDPMQRRREENSVRVTNLSEDVTEADLAELFRPFGHIQRIYLAVDRVTGESRGFAFVTFAHREDGERAIRTLNGYGYGHLILRAEWAAPREPRP